MYIQAHISSEDMSRFRDRLGNLSQSVLAVCDFDLFLTYLYPVWEGSEHDGRVLSDALCHDFEVPAGYYLADAGYGLRRGFFAILTSAIEFGRACCIARSFK